MDELIKQGQWWWLVLPAVLALFGSWLGAIIGKTSEHDQWLRNQRLEKYTTYVNACKHLVRVRRGVPSNRDQFEENFAKLSLIDVELVATKRVQARLDHFNDAFFSYMTSETDRDVLNKNYEASLESLNAALRRDLRIRN